MTLAVRSILHSLRQQAPTGARASAAPAAKHRWFSKAPTEGKARGGAATLIETTQTNAADGGLKPLDRVKLDICGSVEG